MTCPIIISKSINAIPYFLDSTIYDNSRHGITKRIKSTRINSLTQVLNVLVKSVNLQFNGLFTNVGETWARPLSLADIQRRTNLSVKTVSRCLKELNDGGWIETKQQYKRYNAKSGTFDCSYALRKFTEKFWRELGFFTLFQESVIWAKKHAKHLEFLLPFKSVPAKVKKAVESTFETAKDVANGVLRSIKSVANFSLARQAAKDAIEWAKPETKPAKTNVPKPSKANPLKPDKPVKLTQTTEQLIEDGRSLGYDADESECRAVDLQSGQGWKLAFWRTRDARMRG